jgi:peroxiredoxin
MGTSTIANQVGPQTPDGSLTMQQKHDLAFAVLSDPGNVLTHDLGIVAAL